MLRFFSSDSFIFLCAKLQKSILNPLTTSSGNKQSPFSLLSSNMRCLSKSTMNMSPVSLYLASILLHDRIIPTMYGVGASHISIRNVGNTGMNVCGHLNGYNSISNASIVVVNELIGVKSNKHLAECRGKRVE
jgi:hypothetical protein